MANNSPVNSPSGGPAVDKAGNAVVDPTSNVLQLVAAAIQRQDDLRTSETRHIKEIVTLRAGYDEKLREAEAKRIDAVNAVNVTTSQQATKDAETRAATLAATVATSAET